MEKTKNKFWAGRKVFVTGATGFLGSWLVEALLARGASVSALVRDWVPQSKFCREGLENRVSIIQGDITDFAGVERAINESESETVFHLAAQAIVETANRNPLSTFDSNIRGTWNILEACRRSSCVKRIVVASSDKAYGDQAVLPYRENAPLQGRHPYDVSKSCADLIARTYFETYGLPVCVTRMGNLYGGGDANIGRLIPGTIAAALNGKPVEIRSDGTYIRDYLYVADGAEGYIRLAERMDDPKVVGEAFNFSNESQLTVKELVAMILRLMDRQDLKPKILATARHEILNQYLSAEKARKLLDWKPLHGLEEGLKQTIAWYREQPAESAAPSAKLSKAPSSSPKAR